MKRLVVCEYLSIYLGTYPGREVVKRRGGKQQKKLRHAKLQDRRRSMPWKPTDVCSPKRLSPCRGVCGTYLRTYLI